MYNKNTYITKNIKIYSTIRKYIVAICITFLVCGILTFVFYGFFSGSKAIKFVSKFEDIKTKELEKVMTNPRMKFEHSKGVLYNIEAKKAIHKGKEDIEMFDVHAKGQVGNIRSGKLLITQNGNKLHFTDKPFLVIRQVQKENE